MLRLQSTSSKQENFPQNNFYSICKRSQNYQHPKELGAVQEPSYTKQQRIISKNKQLQTLNLTTINRIRSAISDLKGRFKLKHSEYVSNTQLHSRFIDGPILQILFRQRNFHVATSRIRIIQSMKIQLGLMRRKNGLSKDEHIILRISSGWYIIIQSIQSLVLGQQWCFR